MNIYIYTYICIGWKMKFDYMNETKDDEMMNLSMKKASGAMKAVENMKR